ncbi:DUF72 domain-containing protein [Oceanimonas baumannii]|uniref:Uncharacterized protein YecE (DUF72 family) n=1 Tax=Oceanimonas baumannii TaxID=129578 RepID=A0A235CNS6_9GAMM|nr:DUF72 domain-containing protein [Oceanimonas baumannii]OYD26024.1 hypothetical protein B6S09_00075 [Oceanimonas baumannii]TDW62335.1 uncharacterized protein YecE (DUF72 family) [Oceanimonas baumannii]
MPLYLGLSQWSHKDWPGNLLSRGLKSTDHLADYARVFNAVEGNTSFYGVPDTQSLSRWDAMTGDDFRFTFKFPATVSHQGPPGDNIAPALAFIEQLAPLHHKLGLLMLQLPAACGPEQLDGLAQLLQALPKRFEVAVEVRHPAFFAKGEAERRLNRLLIEQHVNRIIMDSRPVFAVAPTTPALADAQQKKPRVPVHIISTGSSPVVRFIGNPALAANTVFWQPWLPRLQGWLDEGKSVYLFVHTADNSEAPALAATIASALNAPLPPFPGQRPDAQGSLF